MRKKEWEENDVNGKRSKNNYNWIRCFTSVGRVGKAVVIIKSVNKEGIYRASHAKSNRIFNVTESSILNGSRIVKNISVTRVKE